MRKCCSYCNILLYFCIFFHVIVVSFVRAEDAGNTKEYIQEKLKKEMQNLEMLQMQLQILEDQELEYEKLRNNGTHTARQEKSKQEGGVKQTERKPVVIKPNENIMLKKEIDEYDIPLYTIEATHVPVSDILSALSASCRKSILVDDNVAPELMASFINLSIQKSPMRDILETVLGVKGLEFIQKENSIYVTSLSQLGIETKYEYYRDKGAQMYQKAQLKYPNDKRVLRAYYELGNYYYDLGFNFLALQEYQVIVKKHRSSPYAEEALFKIGRCYQGLKDPESARRAYFQYIYSYPKNPLVGDALLAIGDTLLSQGFYKKAQEIYERVMQEYSDRKDIAAKAQLNIAKALTKMGKHRKAIQALLRAREQYRSLKVGEEIEFLIGKCLFALEEYQDAKIVLGNLLATEEIGKYKDNASFILGECFYKQELYLEAFRVFKKALETYPNSERAPRGIFLMGKSFKTMNFYASAIKTFQEGIKAYYASNYTDKMALEIGWCYFDIGDYLNAYNSFDSFINNFPNSKLLLNGMVGMADSLFYNQKYDQAIQSYLRILENTEEEKIRQYAFDRIGSCYKSMGKLEDAKKAFRLEIG